MVLLLISRVVEDQLIAVLLAQRALDAFGVGNAPLGLRANLRKPDHDRASFGFVLLLGQVLRSLPATREQSQ